MHAQSTFENPSWEESGFHGLSDEGGPRLVRAVVRRVYHGDIEGEALAELLMSQAADGAAGYVAMERVVASIGDRKGTFVLQHGASMGQGEPRSFGYVVPGSGTGDLAGIRGEATFRHDENGAIFALDYELG